MTLSKPRRKTGSRWFARLSLRLSDAVMATQVVMLGTRTPFPDPGASCVDNVPQGDRQNLTCMEFISSSGLTIAVRCAPLAGTVFSPNTESSSRFERAPPTLWRSAQRLADGLANAYPKLRIRVMYQWLMCGSAPNLKLTVYIFKRIDSSLQGPIL